MKKFKGSHIVALAALAVFIVLGLASGSTQSASTASYSGTTAPQFPSGFVGTWKRDNYNNTLTFTANTLNPSNQSSYRILRSISGDSYTYYQSNSPSYIQSVTIRLVNGNLEISGDSGSGMDNWNGTWKRQQASQTQTQQQPPTQQAQPAQATQTSPYWTGDGGRGMRLGIFLPQSRGLNENQEYLPAMVQGVMVSDISKYSAISVLDRVTLDRVIIETLDPTFAENWDIVRLGSVAQVSHMMTGSIIRTGMNYVLQIHVTDTTPNATTIASYSGTCTAAELDDHSAIHRATLDLLSQMNVQLTAQTRNELSRPSAAAAITAQAALAQGITAQIHGSDETALNRYQEAAASDPSLREAETRMTNLVSALASGDSSRAAPPRQELQAVVVYYTVRFDANGGTGAVPAPITVQLGGSVTLPAAGGMTKAGDYFDGWNISEMGDDTKYAPNSSYRPTRNITLYATWEPTNAVPGANLAAQLGWVRDNVQSGGVYTLRLRTNESIGPQTLSFGDYTNVTIRLQGIGGMRTLSLTSNGYMFAVEKGVTLILDNNITLQGRNENNSSLVWVKQGGAMVMNNNTLITGNKRTDGAGGGVYIENGTFTMRGSAAVRENTARDQGGGVLINGGTFTMEGSATVRNNTATNDNGGGVWVGSNAIFYMLDNATVTGNTASFSSLSDNYARGGGVYVDRGTLSMEGSASVSNNTARNTGSASYRSGHGGGVYFGNGTFTMRDNASVSGNTSSSSNSDGGSGGGVYFANGTFTLRDNATISRNTASSGDGGGVYMANGTFTMQGSAAISGNSATKGGGVRVAGGTFTKTGGTLSGNDAPAAERNTASGLGSAIHAADNRYRNATAGPTVNTANPSFWAND